MLRIGAVPGVTLTKWTSTWRERFRAVRLEVVDIAEEDQRRVLDDADVDLCFVRLPLEVDGLHLIRLYEEVPVAWLAKDHPLAALEELSSADLAGETVLVHVDAAAIDLVASEQAVLRVPLSIARSHSRRDLVHRTVTDAPATSVGLAWLAGSEHPSIQEFVGVVRGRTENSSRSEQERAARRPAEATKAPKEREKAAKGRVSGRGRARRPR